MAYQHGISSMAHHRWFADVRALPLFFLFVMESAVVIGAPVERTTLCGTDSEFVRSAIAETRCESDGFLGKDNGMPKGVCLQSGFVYHERNCKEFAGTLLYAYTGRADMARVESPDFMLFAEHCANELAVARLDAVVETCCKDGKSICTALAEERAKAGQLDEGEEAPGNAATQARAGGDTAQAQSLSLMNDEVKEGTTTTESESEPERPESDTPTAEPEEAAMSQAAPRCGSAVLAVLAGTVLVARSNA